MTFNISKTAALGAASALATVLVVGTALADGVTRRGGIKDAPPPAPAPRACSLSANVALTSEYVFRGFSQTSEGPAIQGGFDATCGIFYAGVWASALDFLGATDPNTFASVDAHIEIDLYAGIKPKTGPITWDLGVIYYAYPNGVDPNSELNYFEVKVGGSAEIWKDGTLGVTVFYSPDYQLETGPVWTVETSFSQVLPKVGMFTPTFSALVGYQKGDDLGYRVGFGNGDDHYWYWNVGLTLGFLEKWSLDFRYWDTNIDNNNASGGFANNFCKGSVLQCDERFVATLKFTY